MSVKTLFGLLRSKTVTGTILPAAASAATPNPPTPENTMAVESLKQVVTSLSIVAGSTYSAIVNKADPWSVVTVAGQALEQVIALTKLTSDQILADLKTVALDPAAQAEILNAIQTNFVVSDAAVTASVNKKAAAILPVAAAAAELALIATKKT